MTKNAFYKKGKKRAVVALAAVCVASFSMCLFTACDDDSDTSTTKTDTGTIANGNFEYYTDDDLLDLVVSPSSWTNSVGTDRNSNSAASSATASGIVNTETSVWAEMTTSAYTPTDVDDAEDNWDDMTAKDRLEFYARIEDGEFEDSDDIEELSDFSLYEDYPYSIEADDLPDCDNPGTHSDGVYTATSEDDETETSVLMIHNYRTDGYGTAQKYTSSTTITLSSNTSAVFSVWVKTEDLTYNNGVTVNGNRGAYIGVTHTVGGTTLDQVKIQNIDTSSVTENNGWVQYTVYLKACSYAESTFTIVLGLGQGSTTSRLEYVEGYAFFDDVECTIISNAAYDEAVKDSGENYTVPYCSLFDDEYAKEFDVSTTYADNYVFAIDLYQGFNALDVAANTDVSFDLTKEVSGNVSYTTTNYKGLGISTDDDVTALGTLSELKAIGNSYLSGILTEDFAEFPFADDENILMLMSAHGAAYTAEMTSDSGLFTLDPGEYKMVSFWAKTSEIGSDYTGATITLVDGDTETTIGSFDSNDADTIDIDDQEDLYDGWVQCFFFVENDTEETKTFSLKFSYGPTTITGTTKASYLEGYAAFTGFETYEMNAEEYAYATTGTYAASVSLTSSTATSTGFDSTIYSNTDAIKEGLATPLTYQGVDGGSSYVGGTDYSYANSNEYAGLINKNYAANYSANYTEDNWLGQLLKIAGYEADSLTTALSASTWWSEIFGTSTQPLLIVNAVEQSYGYIAKATSTLSSSSYTAITLNVKVSKGAIAYIYLIDTSDLAKGYTDPLKIETPAVTYWYDDDGNICTMDPTDDDFNEKTDIAYYVNTNGLYESSDTSDTNIYANLSAYQTAYEYDPYTYDENSDEGKNLVTADGSIVFYYKDGTYYAQYDEENDEYLIAVTNLDGSYARYEGESRELYLVLDNRDGSLGEDWKTVSFYIQTGDESLSYRLEVFSGSRDGSVKSAAGSYVAFDSVTPDDLSDSYEDLISEAIDDIDETDNGITLDDETGRLLDENGNIYECAMYYTYTFYDSDDYLRYDEEADPTNNYILYEDETDDPGNLYSSYQQSAYEEEIIYLEYNVGSTYTTFVNYSPINLTVSADSTTSDDEDEDSEFDTELFLMISSIVLSAVLIFTMLCLLVRRIVKAMRKKTVKKDNVYSAKRRHYAKKLKIAEQNFVDEEPESAPPADEPQDDPYDGENK